MVNGQKVNDYFTTVAQEIAQGQIDPNGDWNQIFDTPANAVSKANTPFFITAITPSSFNMTLTFANGTSTVGEWVARTSTDLLGISSGDDLYQSVVAPRDSDIADEESDTVQPPTNTTAKPVSVTRWPNSAYPSPIVAQQNLTAGGWFTGYFLNKTSTAVISLPSFDFEADAVKGFQDALTLFLAKCKQANMKKLVIDVQANGGGTIVTGFDLFKQVFEPSMSVRSQ
jgi:hypothetical protein